MQIHDVLEKIVSHTALKFTVITGGVAVKKEREVCSPVAYPRCLTLLHTYSKPG